MPLMFYLPSTKDSSTALNKLFFFFSISCAWELCLPTFWQHLLYTRFSAFLVIPHTQLRCHLLYKVGYRFRNTARTCQSMFRPHMIWTDRVGQIQYFGSKYSTVKLGIYVYLWPAAVKYRTYLPSPCLDKLACVYWMSVQSKFASLKLIGVLLC